MLYLFVTISSIVVALDFYTKYLVSKSMMLGESIPIVDGFLSFTYVRNPGAAFGFLAESKSPLKPIFFWCVAAVAIYMLIHYYISTPKEKLKTTALALVLGGAVGNIIDRARWGEVIDFIDVFWKSHHWPAFNIADSCICVGMGLLTISMIREEKQNAAK